MARGVFLSHSSRDNSFCERLSYDLLDYEIQVWYDEWEIKVGDSLRAKISAGIEENDFLAVVLSEASVQSDWVQLELNAALAKELRERRVVVLPILIQECKIPTFLEDKKYADFREDYAKGLDELLAVLAVDRRKPARTASASPTPDTRNDELALPEDEFERWFLDRLQEGNKIRIGRHLWNWRSAVRALEPQQVAEAEAGSRLVLSTAGEGLIHRLAIAGNVALRYAQSDIFDTACDALYEGYLAVNKWGTDRSASVDMNVGMAAARCTVLDKVLALGAGAIDAEMYSYLAPLLSRNTPGEGYWERRGWFRYTLTMAARSTQDRRNRWYLPIERAIAYLESHETVGRYFRDAERRLDCLCQFDLLHGVYWDLRSDRPDRMSDSYPNCALYAPGRVAPLVKKLIAREAPAEVLGNYTDRALADVLIAFAEIVRQDAGLFRYAGWADDGWEDRTIRDFLTANRTAAGTA